MAVVCPQVVMEVDIGKGVIGAVLVPHARTNRVTKQPFVGHRPLHRDVVDSWPVVGMDDEGLVVGPTDRDMVNYHVINIVIHDRNTYDTAGWAWITTGATSYADANVSHDYIVSPNKDH